MQYNTSEGSVPWSRRQQLCSVTPLDTGVGKPAVVLSRRESPVYSGTAVESSPWLTCESEHGGDGTVLAVFRPGLLN